MTEIYICSRRIFLIFLLIAGTLLANAQLHANFTVDKNGGCSPLTVSFTNTSTGASSKAVYSWDLGNGHGSALADAGATYVLEQSYTVKLTVTDSNHTSTQTMQITVYKRPSAGFSSDVTRACSPVTVNFNATATAGDGSIANYFWDFGDGNTQQTPSPQIQHIYNFAANTKVGLTVANSHGCYTSIEKNAVQVLPHLKAAFSVDNTFLCNITDPVHFSDSSTGPGTLAYLWDFGDGTSGTAASPSHVYGKKGTYTVKLVVSNNDGCVDTTTQANYINVANFALAFDTTHTICLNSLVFFKDSSTAGATNEHWFVDGVDVSAYYQDIALYYVFPVAGNHPVQLTASYGNCKVSYTKIVKVNDLPDVQPFVMNIPPYCGFPVDITLKDTTKDAVSWTWRFEALSNSSFSTSQSLTYPLEFALSSGILLTAKNEAGCQASQVKYINIDTARFGIKILSRTGCESSRIHFSANTDSFTDTIVHYQWDFGDGTTLSNEDSPVHVFTRQGNDTVTLTYITNRGCTGYATYTDLRISTKPTGDFTLPSGNTICGNTLTQFSSTSSGDYWAEQWSIAKKDSPDYQIIGFNGDQWIQFPDTGYYNIQLVLLSTVGSTCNDTITKLSFVKVLPPMPKISGHFNTCDNARNLVKFTESSTDALSWTWDFGDSTSHTYNSRQDTVSHTYAQTGFYKVVLTAVNGQCAVKDSIYAPVLLKQKPVLSAQSAVVCLNGAAQIHLGNYEFNPDPHFIDVFDADYYTLAKLQYGDGSSFAGGVDRVDSMGYWSTWYSDLVATLNKFQPAETSIRAISTSQFFGCNDTSNYITLKIDGPKAGFTTIEGGPCFAQPVIIQDTSRAGGNAPIKTWQWDFGDGILVAENKGGTEQHIYAIPGRYLVSLKVTDSSGCSDSTGNYPADSLSWYVNPSGPGAAFTISPAEVTPNTPITFTNNTNVYNSSNTQYQWVFGDGSTSAAYAPSHTYSRTGIDTIKLIAINPDTHCRDTSIQVIDVKLINTQFSFTKFYVSSSTCPPVIVHFTNTSSNAVRVAWDFGDGSKADNQNNPSHTYYQAGVYKVTMYGYGYNGTTDTTVDSITVRAPSAKLKADKLSGCLSQTIAFTAQVTNASFIIWDFADGGLQQTQGTTTVHQYEKPGLYSPSLILTDSGCAVTASLGDTIIIDALDISFLKNSDHYCDSANVLFDPEIISIAADSFHQPLFFQWNFGTDAIRDTSNIRNPLFSYNEPGKYIVRVQVQSTYGCTRLATDTIVVVKKSKGIISGPSDICQGIGAQFSGQAVPASNNLLWKWTFSNGIVSALPTPLPLIPADTGIIKVSLVLVNDGCADTSLYQLKVHSTPLIQATPMQVLVCLGNSVQLSAGGGSVYSWSPSRGLNNAAIAEPTASPVVSTKYVVEVTNAFGCKDIDSVQVTVASPFKIEIHGDSAICTGGSTHLFAAGASSYSWINITAGLSNTQIADPVALPAAPVIYTVVGYDAGHCFTDTASINIQVYPMPVIIHQPDVETLIGATVQLQAGGGPGNISWYWSPADYLSCTNCASPVSTPLNPITYVVTGTTVHGCAASDTIAIKLVCAPGQIYIPNIFSPNGDGKNDLFYIHGKGIRIIRSLRIFNRYGETIFERANIKVDDRSAAWDGTVKDSPAPAGAYVYLAELVCDGGEVFPMKGTVILLR